MKKATLMKFLNFFSAVLMTMYSCIPTNAVNTAIVADIENDTENYEEMHFQINFSDVDIVITEENDILMHPKAINHSGKHVKSHQNTDAARMDVEIAALMEVFSDFPEVKQELITELQNSDSRLCAMSFTEVPLVWMDGHYQRASASSHFEASEEHGRGKFLMYTVIAGGYADSTGIATYTAYTRGRWSQNSISGHSNYPDAGEDFVLQTSPTDFVRKADTFSAEYDNNPIIGVSNDDFWCCDGNADYIQYAILDDPSGYRQNKNFTLTTESDGLASNRSRMIQSYYVHTWKQMTISVEVSSSTGGEFELSITPSIENKQWQVYDYITFNF